MGIQYAILFGLIAMVGSGLSGVIAREPVRALGSDRALFWRGVVMVTLHIPLLFLFSSKAITWQGIALALGVGMIGYLPIYFFFRAISHGRVGVVSPISNSSAVITAMLAVFILGEPFGASLQAPVPGEGDHGRQQACTGGDQGKGQQKQYVNERLATVSTACENAGALPSEPA